MTKLALVLGMVLVVVPIGIQAQPAYKCLDAQGRLVLGQGDPPAGLKCSEEARLRPESSLPEPSVNWEQRLRESRADTERTLRRLESERAERERQEQAVRGAQLSENARRLLEARRVEAAEQAQQEFTVRWANIVGECQRQARNRGDSGFSTFMPAPGRVTMLGTARARYAFTKCMAEAGQPLELK